MNEASLSACAKTATKRQVVVDVGTHCVGPDGRKELARPLGFEHGDRIDDLPVAANEAKAGSAVSL